MNPLRGLVRRAARRYVTGPRAGDALVAAGRVTERGADVTIGYLNGGDDPPRRAADAALEAIAAAPVSSRVAIKLPALGTDRGLVDEILGAAADRRLAIHFDALRPSDADPILALLAERGDHRSGGEPLGCTLPGRWIRSDSDAEVALELGLRVRVVKGQFAAPPDAERDPTEGVRSLVDRLAGRVSQVSVASHDPGLVADCAKRLTGAATPCELELLYGLPTRRVLGVAEGAGLAVRVYLPFGTAYLPYGLRGADRLRMTARLIRDVLRPERSEPLAGLPGGGR
ncbi:MAG: proline dehydrogenase [Solirubrobacterales bacterium]